MQIKNQSQKEPGKPKLLDQVKTHLRSMHYSRRTEESYVNWIKRFIIFHNKTHPEKLGKDEIRKFLNHLAVDRNVSASTQNQALQGILFLYKEIIHKDVGWVDDIQRPTKPKHIPVVFTKAEAHSIIQGMEGLPKLIAGLLYGSGLRLSEALRLRVKDIDFELQNIVVHDGKGEQDVNNVPGVIANAQLLAIDRGKGDQNQACHSDPASLDAPGSGECVEQDDDVRIVDQQDHRVQQHQYDGKDRKQVMHLVYFAQIKYICQKGKTRGGDELQTSHTKPHKTQHH